MNFSFFHIRFFFMVINKILFYNKKMFTFLFGIKKPSFGFLTFTHPTYLFSLIKCVL